MAATNTLDLSRQWTSLSGCDINIIIAGEILGSAVSMSHAINREKVPVYTCGSPDPRSFSRGKRALAGSFTSLMLDKHILYKEPFKSLKFLARQGEIFASPADLDNALSANGTGSLNDLDTVGGAFSVEELSSNYKVSAPWYVDQIPPVDAVLLGANEYGNLLTMRIYGIEILNEGGGFSVDDMVIEIQTTYVCRSIRPWAPLGSYDLDNGGGFTSAAR